MILNKRLQHPVPQFVKKIRSHLNLKVIGLFRIFWNNLSDDKF